MTKDMEPLRRMSVQRLARERWAAGRQIWATDTRGRNYTTTDITVDTTYADAVTSRHLRLPEGFKLARRFRRYWVDGHPVQLATSYLPYRLVRGTPIMQMDTGPGGTPQVLCDLGHAPAFASEEIRHDVATGEEAAWLHIEPEDPVIHVQRVLISEAGAPVELNAMVLDARVYVLQYDFAL